MQVQDFKDNLSGMLHGGTLKKVRNVEGAMERAANTMLSKIDPIDTMRTVSLSSTVHDDVYNYSLPSDYKKIIDLYPQARRGLLDSANRNFVERFDLRKKLTDKTISIEGSEGSKVIRINWRTRRPKTLNECDSTTANGTWSVVGTASNLSTDTINYVSGGGALKFDVATTGDGIQNTTMNEVDLTDEDEVGDVFIRFYIKNSADLANLNSISAIWGNNFTTKYWTGVAQTAQADGTAFKVGWNEVSIPWSTATETGTVTPATSNSLKVTFNVDAAISDIRVDNITCSIGSNFDIKYYSKFILKNTAGTWITKTTSGDDTIVLDSDAIQIYQLEVLKACAHQVEGQDSTFDLNYATAELDVLYKRYKVQYPSQSKNAISYYGSSTTQRHFR